MTLRNYRYMSLTMMMAFGIVGICFLFMSGGVIALFNEVSAIIGFEQIEPGKEYFYVVLAAAYMYVVALLAFLMYRDPKNPMLPFILFNAKLASSLASVFAFIVDRQLLIYITNAVVDGVIALLVIAMYRNIKRVPQ